MALMKLQWILPYSFYILNVMFEPHKTISTFEIRYFAYLIYSNATPRTKM